VRLTPSTGNKAASALSLSSLFHVCPAILAVMWLLEHMKAKGLISGYELHPIDFSKKEQVRCRHTHGTAAK
jgi:hypothetical protein